MKTIAVLGGGITGLCTVHYLQRALQAQNKKANIIVIEKEAYLGGKIHTAHDKGFIMETGADSIVARYSGVMDLVRELDFEDELVYNETGISYIYTNNKLHAIPADSTFGIPMSRASLEASTLISEAGKQAALQDLEKTECPFTKENAIGEFLTYYLGEEIVQKQIAPVLSGVYSGDLNQLSIASTLPYLVDYKKQYGSIMKGFEANKEQFVKAANKKFISFKNGLDTLLYRIEETQPDVTFKKGVAVDKLTKMGEQYAITLENSEAITADEVVLAMPNDAIEKVLQNTSLDTLTARFATASAITMYLGFAIPDSVLPADGTGFIVSENTNVVCNAATWTSRKWKHTSETGNLLVRVFYKSVNPQYDKLSKMTDAELTEVALNDIKHSLGIDAVPTIVDVTKWLNKMPRYDLEHRVALQGLEQAMAQQYPNVHLAGCSYYGVGVGACIQNGKELGEQLATKIN